MKTKFSLSIFFLSSLLLASCGGGEQKEETKKDEKKVLPLIATETVTHRDFENFFEVQGVVMAEKNVTLTAEMGGLIRKILVEEGQFVKTGQTLVLLDAEVIQKNIQEVEKSLELANYVFEKQRNLHNQSIGSDLQYEQAKNNKERLEQTLETLKTQASKSVISAPFDGYVDEIFPHEGEMAMPQLPVIRLLNLNKVTIEADIMESYLRTVSVGKKVDVKVSALDTVISDAVITRVGKFINPSNRTFKVSVSLSNSDGKLLPNLVSIVRVKNEILDSVLTVPNTALLQSSSGQNYVFVADKDSSGHKIRKVILELGPSNDSFTVVEAGDIKASDEVVVDGARGVQAGMTVAIRSKK